MIVASLPKLDKEALAQQVLDNARGEKNPFAPNCTFVYKPPLGQEYLYRLHPLVEQIAGRTLYPVTTFVRVHPHGTRLDGHFDRRGLDWTLSITVEADEPWPLKLLRDWEWVPMLAPQDGAVLVNGTCTPHRRSPYPGERAIVMTLSYSESPDRKDDVLPTEAPPYAYVKRFLSPDVIPLIYQQMGDMKMSPGHLSYRNEATTERTCQLAWLRRPEWQWLYDVLRERMAAVNHMSWRLDVEGETTDELQFTRYDPGEYYIWHVDRAAGAAGMCPYRTLSASILLRRAKRGGGIELKDGGVVDLSPGDAVLFPSHAKHRALEVEKGTRDALVMWLSQRRRN